MHDFLFSSEKLICVFIYDILRRKDNKKFKNKYFSRFFFNSFNHVIAIFQFVSNQSKTSIFHLVYGPTNQHQQKLMGKRNAFQVVKFGRVWCHLKLSYCVPWIFIVFNYALSQLFYIKNGKKLHVFNTQFLFLHIIFRIIIIIITFKMHKQILFKI